MTRQPHPDCVEYLLEDGRRFAWSESNVQYEEVPEDGASFTVLRQRLTTTQNALRGLADRCLDIVPDDSDLYKVAKAYRRLVP